MYTKFLILLFLSLGLVAFAACGDDDDDNTPTAAISTATATTRPQESTATVAATATPAVSGVRVVDDVIAAVRAKDAAKLTAMLHPFPRPCTEPQGIGAIPCPTGLPIGTMVMGIGSGQCEGSHLSANDPAIATAIAFFLSRATTFYAVVKGPAFPGETIDPSKYQIVFEPGLALSVDDQGITRFSVACGPKTAAEFVASGRYGPNPEYLVKP